MNFNLAPDPKKLIEQDKEFAEYVKEIVFQMTLLEKSANDFIAAIYSFYTIDMTQEQVIEWAKQNKRFRKPEGEGNDGD